MEDQKKEVDITKLPVQEEKSATPDLDKLRDEKCIPIARAIMQDMVTDLLPEDANEKVDYNPIVKKILQRNLDADCNIAMESSYIFQLILGVLSGLNATVQSAKTVLIDDVRYASIGRRILAIVSEANVKMGSITPDEMVKQFADAKIKIDDLFIAEQLSMLEVKYIMDNIFTSFDMVSKIYSKSIESSIASAQAKLFGLETMNDLGVKRLDDVLKAGYEPKAQDEKPKS